MAKEPYKGAERRKFKRSQGAEKRKYRRLKKQFVVRLRFHSKSRIAIFGEYDMVSVRNISAGGALFNYDRKIRLGETITMGMQFPMLKEPIRCTGEIVRVESPSSSGDTSVLPVYFIAIRFIATSEEETRAIDSFVKKNIVKERSTKTGPKKATPPKK
ncbi:MAG: PilZ domain-containing protein [Candidatus Omnitrophica bacterium]|nr:PilZ domain-containing protein [Candidatus Omnitrophota bacterium]